VDVDEYQLSVMLATKMIHGFVGRFQFGHRQYKHFSLVLDSIKHFSNSSLFKYPLLNVVDDGDVCVNVLMKFLVTERRIICLNFERLSVSFFLRHFSLSLSTLYHLLHDIIHRENNNCSSFNKHR